jgi:hypothetical protein
MTSFGTALENQGVGQSTGDYIIGSNTAVVLSYNSTATTTDKRVVTFKKIAATGDLTSDANKVTMGVNTGPAWTTLTKDHIVDSGVLFAMAAKQLQLGQYGASFTGEEGAKLSTQVTDNKGMWNSFLMGDGGASVTPGSANAKVVIKGTLEAYYSTPGTGHGVGWIVPSGTTDSDQADFALGTGGTITYKNGTPTIAIDGNVTMGWGGADASTGFISVITPHEVNKGATLTITTKRLRIHSSGTIKGAAGTSGTSGANAATLIISGAAANTTGYDVNGGHGNLKNDGTSTESTDILTNTGGTGSDGIYHWIGSTWQ